MSVLSIPNTIGGEISAAPHNENNTAISSWANGNIGADNLASNAVTAAKIASGAVETAKIAAGAVTAAKMEAIVWHTIGAAGEPAFENSWANYGATHLAAKFCKDAQGFVHLQGTIKSGTLDAAAFTLPTGYRPTAICSSPSVSNGALGYVQVYADGSVRVSGSNANLSLDSVIFYAG